MDSKKPQRIPIDLNEGYWPHFKAGFFARYGLDSLFVRSVADSLTARHVKVLIKANRISPNTKPLQIGSKEALKALEFLLDRIRADGAVEDILHILRESTGVREPIVLDAEVDGLYGQGVFARWLSLFEQCKFDEAGNLLVK
jgi:hypothetical protein